ncbi:MAG: protein O-mannosyl-transferase family [Candidatus Zhuqueibacterota bacterium]
MQNDKRLNRILAFFVFLVSLVVYLKTVAPTTSFWDCGEFIACSYILGVPHPPGAPLYILVGRIFSMLPLAADIGLRVNIVSSLSSSLTIMFTYLIIVRLVSMFRGRPSDTLNKIIVYGSGVIGALTFAFTDSFWFNAVEAEVYAISILFTAVVLLLALVWWEKADEPSSDKYILILAYAVGMVIGVHLLSILALPALFVIFYFRKYKKLEWTPFLTFTFISVLIFIVIYPGIVKWLPNLALFINKQTSSTMTAIIFLLLTAALIYALARSIISRNRTVFLALASFLLIIIGVSTYTAIYIRSNLNPAIDENDPETMANMVSYLNREQYGDWSIMERRAPLWKYQIEKMFIRYFNWQYLGQGTTLDDDSLIVENYSLKGLWGLPFLIGLIGMFHHFRKDWKHASSIMMLFLWTGLAIVIYLNQEDPQPRERDYVYVGAFFAFALWIGIGVTAISDYVLNSFKKMKSQQKLILASLTMFILLLAGPINLLSYNFESHDRSGNYVAYDYSFNILQSCEPNAILFTNGDNDTFPLWFLQEVYGIRKDIRVVNLSLLNTHWYIKQLRDQEPKVPINMRDNQIERLQPQYWPEAKTVRLDVPKEAYLRDMNDVVEQKQLMENIEEPPAITFELEPTLQGQGIRVQDIMIINIIQSNRFRRPIYFALTVSRDNQLNMFKYLRMDGLVFKVVTYTDEPLSPTHLENNLFEKFRYRNLANPEVYYNDNIKGLLRNYQGAFYSLAQYYGKEKMYDRMAAVLDTLNKVMPNSVIPMRKELQFEMGRMYYLANQPEKFRDVLFQLIKRSDVPLNERLQYAGWYSQLYPQNATPVLEYVQMLVKEFPNQVDSYYWLAGHYLRTKQYQQGIDILNQWLAIKPDDKTAKSQVEQFQKLITTSGKDTSISENIPADTSKSE